MSELILLPYPDWPEAPVKGSEGLMKHIWHTVEAASERNLQLRRT